MKCYNEKKKKLNRKGIPFLLTYFLQMKCEINYFVRKDTLTYRDMSTSDKHNEKKLLRAKFS